MAGIWEQFKQDYDPQAVGMQLLASTGDPRGTGYSLGSALMAGRQARLAEAQARADAAAAKRAEGIKMAETGVYETDQGFGRRQVKQDPTGGSYMVDMGPGGSLSTQQLYAPPAKPEEQKENYTAVQAVNEAGQPVVYMVNKYNPRDYYELGGAIQKGSKGSSAGGREAAPQDAYAGRTRNVMDEVAKYFPIQDSSGKPVDWRNYDPTKGHVVSSETIFTGPRLGSLPTFMQSQEGADLKAQLGQFSGTTFLSELVAAKGRGATFGALSNEEKKAIEEAATIAGDPTISNERRIQAMQRLDAEIEQAVGNWERRSGSTQKRPQGRTTSSGVSWSID